MNAAPPRFLIDENLSVELLSLAHAAGFASQPVNELGLRSRSDAIVMARVLAEDWTLVTNNWREFLARYRARAPLHAGLVLLVSASGIDEQKQAFALAIQAIRHGADLTNAALFVERKERKLQAPLEPWPSHSATRP
jgi:predicted nuclease of predicted toxin-antitoxin system